MPTVDKGLNIRLIGIKLHGFTEVFIGATDIDNGANVARHGAVDNCHRLFPLLRKRHIERHSSLCL